MCIARFADAQAYLDQIASQVAHEEKFAYWILGLQALNRAEILLETKNVKSCIDYVDQALVFMTVGLSANIGAAFYF